MIIVPPPSTDSAPSAPTFTVGSALRWLGHSCSPRCSTGPLETLTATVWFLRSEWQLRYPLEAVVLVDPVGGAPAALLDRLHRAIHCARSDAISIQSRRAPWATITPSPSDEVRARAGDVVEMSSSRPSRRGGLRALPSHTNKLR